MNNQSLSEMELHLRSFGQYLNYLVNSKAKKVETVTLGQIPIDDEIHVVENHIKDLKIRIGETRLRIELQFHHHDVN